MLKTFSNTCCIAVDLTESTKELYKQTDEDKYKQKLQIISEILDIFLKDYFDETKIRKLLTTTIHDDIIEMKTNFVSTYKEYKQKFNLLTEKQSGNFSLCNALRTLTTIFSEFKNTTKEIVFFLSSEKTIDKTDIYIELQKAVDEGIHISIITIGCFINIFQKITEITGGCLICFKKTPRNMFRKVLKENYILKENKTMQKVVFPIFYNQKVVCACHGNIEWIYSCSFCFSPICSLPQICPVCNNFNSLFIFQKRKVHKKVFLPVQKGICSGCLSEEDLFSCSCKEKYCSDCSKKIKDNIVFCPTCS